jgi:alpha-beta hydrolase superfamily lysophospholipase/DNA-binding CsgD family transcriptional regulator
MRLLHDLKPSGACPAQTRKSISQTAGGQPLTERNFTFVRPDGLSLHGLEWHGEDRRRPRVLIGHSHVVHAGQLRALGQALADAGFAVLAPDMRGHGRSTNRSNPPMHIAGTRGWALMVADFVALCDHWLAAVPHDQRMILAPNILALVCLEALKQRPDLAGQIVLIAPPPNQPLLARLGAVFAAARARMRDAATPDEQFLHHIYSYLGNHLPDRSHPLDVMSPDRALIDRVLADPLCWRVPTTAYWQAVFHAQSSGWSFPRGLRLHPDTRFLILYGEADPMTRDGRFCAAMVERLLTLGPREVSARGVQGGRSGLFMEQGRLDISGQILAWRDAVSGAGGALRTAPAHPPGQRDIDVITEHFRRTGASLDPLSPQDFVTLCYGGINDESRWVDLMMRIMLTMSEAGDDGFEAFLQEMMPHWDQAFALHQKLLTDAALGDLWGEMLERIGMGCALIDQRGNILHRNNRYEAALLEVAGEAGKASEAALTAELLRASGLRSDGTMAEGAVLRWEGAPVGLIVQPPALARHARRLGNPMGLIVLRSDPGSDDLAGMIEIGWALTPQEARVALEVMRGHSPQDIATRLGLSVNTVRSHLAQAYAKTETAGKAELAAALHRSPLAWIAAAPQSDAPAEGAANRPASFE